MPGELLKTHDFGEDTEVILGHNKCDRPGKGDKVLCPKSLHTFNLPTSSFLHWQLCHKAFSSFYKECLRPVWTCPSTLETGRGRLRLPPLPSLVLGWGWGE